MMRILGKSTVSPSKPPVNLGATGVEIGDRTVNALQLGATGAKSVGGKSGTSEQVQTPPHSVMSQVGSMSGTANNAINVADTFESGVRVIKDGLQGNMPSSMPSTTVAKTVGKAVPFLNVFGALSSLSNTRDVFTNPTSTPSQKAHAVIDSATSVLSAVPYPPVALGATLVNVLNGAVTPTAPK